MDDPIDNLVQRALALTSEERSRLVDLLIESLHEAPIAEVEEAWRIQIELRLSEYDRGQVKSIPAANVFARARSIAR
jgi:putative addiction module component (TIGR02574 family)